jgi:phospholipid-transporting ATPase
MSSVQRFLKAFGLAKQELNRTFVQEGSRNVYVNDPVKASSCDYLHNSVTTGKYTIATFLIKFLVSFYLNYANLFFLFISLLQLVGNLGSTSKYGTALPLFVIMLLTASKELLEDSKRHAQDRVVNNRLVKVLKGQTFIPKKWNEVKVGDVVRVENSEFFPADLLLLSSSEPEAICYIETSNLDGETNLKIRQGLQETAHILSPEDASSLDGIFNLF